jgi:predicted P-loop ATPase
MKLIQEIDGRPATDGDILALNAQLESSQHIQVKIDDVRHALEHLCNENAYHPVKDYLASLPWDGKPRVDNFLTDYYATEKSAYATGVSRALLIGAVQRIENPGCIFRYVPTINRTTEHRQEPRSRPLVR